jgi:hypothetical protein
VLVRRGTGHPWPLATTWGEEGPPLPNLAMRRGESSVAPDGADLDGWRAAMAPR